jgi:hypothetical protein
MSGILSRGNTVEHESVEQIDAGRVSDS